MAPRLLQRISRFTTSGADASATSLEPLVLRREEKHEDEGKDREEVCGGQVVVQRVRRTDLVEPACAPVWVHPRFVSPPCRAHHVKSDHGIEGHS
jgi:hypothetical protein